MYEVTTQNVTTRSTVGLSSSGEKIYARTFPRGALIDLDDLEAASLVKLGDLRSAGEIPSVSAGELEHARAVHQKATADLDAASARLAEARRRERDLELRADAKREIIERAERDTAWEVRQVRIAEDAVSSAARALADVVRRQRMTDARRELAELAKRRAEQDAVVEKICDLAVELKTQIDAAVDLNGSGDLRELRGRIVITVSDAMSRERGARSSELAWVFQ